MAHTISTRNAKSQCKIFLPEMTVPEPLLVAFPMPKQLPSSVPEIHLGEWLDFFEIGPTEAASIAGCKQSYISNIIAHRRTNINALFLFRLSEHMHVNVNDFYRPLPGKTQLSALTNLSPKARTAILEREERRG